MLKKRIRAKNTTICCHGKKCIQISGGSAKCAFSFTKTSKMSWYICTPVVHCSLIIRLKEEAGLEFLFPPCPHQLILPRARGCT